MKIAVVGPTYPYKGGIAHYTTLMVKELRKHHQVDYYSFSRLYPALLFPGQQKDQSRDKIVEQSWPTVDWLKPASWRQTARLIIKSRVKLVIIPWWTWFWAPSTYVLGRQLKSADIKIIYLCHNTADHEHSRTKKLIAKAILGMGDGYICHSRQDKERLVKWFPGAKVEQITHPTYSNFDNSQITKVEAKKRLRIKGKIILMFGHVRQYKGLSVLLRAMPSVVKATGATLLVAGEFWGGIDEYNAQADKLRISQQVKLVNSYIPNEEVASYFVAADCVVLPYLSASGTGIGQIAIAFNKPMVASAVGDLPSLMGQTGGKLVPPNNPRKLARAIIASLTNSQMVKRQLYGWEQLTRAVEILANKRPTIVLTGTYSSHNKGDAAMQLSTIGAIKKQFPEAKIYVNSPFPKIDQDYYPQAEILPASRRNIFKASGQVVMNYLYRVVIKQLGLEWSWLLASREQQVLARADLVIDLSGDTITEDYGPHVTYSHLLPLLQGLALGKPVFVCAQSMGPFTITKPLVKWVLGKVAAVTAREQITKDYLTKEVLGSDNEIRLTGDMAFLLKPVGDKRLHEIWQKEELPTAKKTKLVGVSVSKLVEDKLVNFDEVMAKALDEIVERHNCVVMLIAHVTGPTKDKDDRLAARRVRARMNHKSKAMAIRGDYRPEELKALIGQCDLFMGARMHANIAAVSMGVPTIPIGYSHKTLGVMKRMGIGKYVLKIEDLTTNQIIKSVGELWEQKKRIQMTLIDKRVIMAGMAKKNLQIAKTILAKDGK